MEVLRLFYEEKNLCNVFLNFLNTKIFVCILRYTNQFVLSFL